MNYIFQKDTKKLRSKSMVSELDKTSIHYPLDLKRM